MLTAGQSAARASYGLVLLHGRGAGARDIIGFGEALALPELALIAPEAPGLSWWPTSFLAPAAQMEPYVTAGLAAVDQAVAVLEAGGLTRDRIGVLGFSQGGCLALEYLARQGAGFAMGAGLSAGLVGTGDLDAAPTEALYGYGDKALDYDTNLSGVQLYTSCHAADPHIPHARFERSAEVMRDLGAEVEARTKPGPGHGIDAEDVAHLRAMLNQPAS